MLLVHALVSAPSLVACGRDPPDLAPPDSAPPERAGSLVCVQCDMTIREARFSASALIGDPPGPRRVDFDDIGCFLDHQREHPEVRFLSEHVRDAGTMAWVEANTAWFVLSDRIATPMASGIAAYANLSEAQDKAREVGEAVIDLGSLREARRAFMEQRYGSPVR